MKFFVFISIIFPLLCLAQKKKINVEYHGKSEVHLYSISNHKGYPTSVYKGTLPYKGKIDFSVEEDLFLIANGYITKRIGSEDFSEGLYQYEVEKYDTEVDVSSSDWIYFESDLLRFTEDYLSETLGEKLVTPNTKSKEKARFELSLETVFAKGLVEKQKLTGKTKLSHFKSCRWIVRDVVLDKEVYNKVHYGGYYIGDQSYMGGKGTKNAEEYVVLQHKLPFKYATLSLLSDGDFYNSIVKKNDLDVVYEEPIPLNIDDKSNVDGLEEAQGSVVKVKILDGIGSGFFISNDGYILTSFHLIKNSDSIEVQLSNGMVMEAELVRYNIKRNVALLKIELGGSKTFSMGDAEKGIGTEVYAIGVSIGGNKDLTMSKGVISGKPTIEDVVYTQSDVATTIGNSGGPLITKGGIIVGIVVGKITGEGIEGLTFSIPIREAFKALNCKF